MSVSSKCYYAIRAIYALAERGGTEPMKIAEIAVKEQIPIRFLEVILGQLKGGGFVQSRRGADGGYRLARAPDAITIGEIMRYVDGPIAPIDCVSQSRPKECEFHGECHFFRVLGSSSAGDLQRGRSDHVCRHAQRKSRTKGVVRERVDDLERVRESKPDVCSQIPEAT